MTTSTEMMMMMMMMSLLYLMTAIIFNGSPHIFEFCQFYRALRDSNAHIKVQGIVVVPKVFLVLLILL